MTDSCPKDKYTNLRFPDREFHQGQVVECPDTTFRWAIQFFALEEDGSKWVDLVRVQVFMRPDGTISPTIVHTQRPVEWLLKSKCVGEVVWLGSPICRDTLEVEYGG